jgi:hypothetical protein
MYLIKDVRIRPERAETEVCAEIERPAAIYDARKISGVRVPEFSATQGDEAPIFLLF